MRSIFNCNLLLSFTVLNSNKKAKKLNLKEKHKLESNAEMPERISPNRQDPPANGLRVRRGRREEGGDREAAEEACLQGRRT